MHHSLKGNTIVLLHEMQLHANYCLQYPRRYFYKINDEIGLTLDGIGSRHDRIVYTNDAILRYTIGNDQLRLGLNDLCDYCENGII